MAATFGRVADRLDWRDELVVHHHPLLLVGRAWVPTLLMLLAAAAIVILAAAPGRTDLLLFTMVLWLAALAFVAGACWAIREYLLWSADQLRLTEHRLVIASGIPRLSERRRELRFDRIESVELAQPNPLMRWFGCADLIIAVAGGAPLRFAAASEPLAVRDHLSIRLRERDESRELDDEAAVRASVERLVLADDTPMLTDAAATTRPLAPRPARGGSSGSLVYFGRRIEGEVWQRHPWFLARAWFAPLALLACACATPFAFDWLGVVAPQRLIGPLTLAGVVAALLWLTWTWGNWRNDYYVITPERLIAIDQLPLGLRQQITEASLDKVQDIGYRIPHPWAMLLGYGDVLVNTASDSQSFVFRGIARPRALADQIDRFVAARKLTEQHSRHESMRAEFARWLTTYEEVMSDE